MVLYFSEMLLGEENTITARLNGQRIQPDLIADVTLSAVARVGVCGKHIYNCFHFICSYSFL